MNTTAQIQQTIWEFIDKRLAAKLETKTGESERRKLRDKYEPAAWIADAAHRVNQIQLVTHAIKFSHPDARGSSLFSDGCEVAGEDLVGTHTLGQQKSLDVVGNAANLDVYKFLSLEVEGVPIWERARDEDVSLLEALPGTAEQNRAWVKSFATLALDTSTPASHPLARQVYWHLGANEYHLLQPMFPTSLAHRVRDIVSEARFSDDARAARESRRNAKPHAHGIRDWPELMAQRFGGAKPQNISQLNSERHGEAWLLPSLPPPWRLLGIRPPLYRRTVFEHLPNGFDHKAKELGNYLTSVRDWNNKDIRDGRERRVTAIIDDLIFYGFSLVEELSAGWSADEGCKLDKAERYWLDPKREGEDFQQLRNSTDWPRDIADRFGNWLNSRLRKHGKLPVGDPEHREWLREFESELAVQLREIKSV